MLIKNTDIKNLFINSDKVKLVHLNILYTNTAQFSSPYRLIYYDESFIE